MKKVLKIFFTLLFIAGFVCAFGEAETLLAQIVSSGSSMLAMWLAYKGLESIKAF